MADIADEEEAAIMAHEWVAVADEDTVFFFWSHITLAEGAAPITGWYGTTFGSDFTIQEEDLEEVFYFWLKVFTVEDVSTTGIRFHFPRR